jgi:four helix bundle protein
MAESVCIDQGYLSSGAFARDFGLASQIQRASVSIMSNIAEGFERSGLGERVQFVSVAKASCAEVRSQLSVALDAEYISQEKFDALLSQADEAGPMLGKLHSVLSDKRHASN